MNTNEPDTDNTNEPDTDDEFLATEIETLWEEKEILRGKIIAYKSQLHGAKDKPPSKDS
jgi:hypothetical protein